MSLKISVIVTTYNWPHALRMVLKALVEQKTTCSYEIIVADDGSKEDTARLIQEIKQTTHVPLLHIWQPDEGFRAAAIRNKAILAAKGDYIIFLDGDCIPRQNFIENHYKLAEPKTFVVGNRVLLNREFTVKALSHLLPLYHWSFWDWCVARFLGHCNRILPFLSLPWDWVQVKNPFRWQGAKGCNLAIWKIDLIHINGWEEKFVGWGYEDSDLVIRLLRSGVQRKSGRFRVPVIHLWHPENDRSKETHNWARLKAQQTGMQICAEIGLNQLKLSVAE